MDATPDDIISTTIIVLIDFDSDGSGQDLSWRLEWTEVD